MIKSFQLLKISLDDFVKWFNCISKPVKSCREFHKILINDDAKLVMTFRLFLVTLLMAFVLEIPLYTIAGIELENLGFGLLRLSQYSVCFLITGILVHIGLRIFKIPSHLPDTLLLFAICVASFLPFLVLIFYPMNALTLAELKALVPLKVSLQDLLKILVEETFEISRTKYATLSYFGVYERMIFPLSLLFMAALFSMFAKSVSDRYQSEKYRTFSAINFSCVFLVFIPIQLTVLIYRFIALIIIGYQK